MFVSQACLWPFVAMAGGTVIVAAVRCLALLIGLWLALKGAPRADRAKIYGEFARAVGSKSRPDDSEHAPGIRRSRT